MRVGIVLVHYHCPGLLRSALAALEVASRAGDIELEVVVVDNGSSAEEREVLLAEQLRSSFQLIEPGTNLGYAGGINRGVAALAPILGRFEALVVMNPDVLVDPNLFIAFREATAAGIQVAGPRFFWDGWDRYQLPVTEKRTLADELARAVAAASPSAKSRAKQRWRHHAYPFLTCQTPRLTCELSGALLWITPQAWSQIGPFDEGFSLYFEETDWLHRAKAAKVVTAFVPAARAIHLYAQSTPAGGAQDRFQQSQRRFRRKQWGSWATRLLEWLETRRPRGAAEDIRVAEPAERWPADPLTRYLEISPSPLGFPAACWVLPVGLSGEEPLVSDQLLRQMAPGRYWLRALDAHYREAHLRSIDIRPRRP